MWCRDRPPIQIDSVFLASASQHLSTKYFCIVGVDSLRKAPAWPRRSDVVLRKPLVLREYRVADAHSDRHRIWRIKGNIEADDHPTEDIDRQRDPWPAGGSAIDVVDQDDIEQSVVYLNYGQAPISPSPMADYSRQFPACRPTAP